MRVALLGATGFVGTATKPSAGGTLCWPSPAILKVMAHEHLIVKAGDVYDTEALAALIRGSDAVISTFNPGWKNPNLYTDQVKGTTSIICRD